jgi:hypothetical protein
VQVRAFSNRVGAGFQPAPAALKGRPYVDSENRVGAGFQPALAALKGRPSVDSEARSSGSGSGVWFVLAFVVWLAGCSSPRATTPQTAQTAAPASSSDCVPAATLSADARAAAATLQRAVEAGPIFGAGGGRAAIASCRVAVEDGATSLEYRFRDGSTLRATSDPRIESTEQTVRFVAPPPEDPDAILKRAERAGYGDQGCGIDWNQAETREASDEKGAVDRIYRGDSCNCQARVRRDAGGRVVALTLRSAC